MSIEDSIAIINGLHEKYANDPYMSVRLHNYIINQLPSIMSNISIKHQMSIVRLDELTVEYDSFIQTFLNNNRYFYSSSTENFFYYDGIHYKIFNEDGILHHILTTITRDRSLMSWKYKTKVSIMKRIKDNSLLSSVPESATIQNVIMALYPAVFATKSEAKYFLTVLGDNITRKNTILIHILPPYAKAFIRELNNFSQINVGSNLFQTFKLKYHEHDYANCRIINMNETVKYENVWRNIIDEYGIDVICVACHYSMRFGSSDEYLTSSHDLRLKSHAFYLKDRTSADLVDGFIRDYITLDSANSGLVITWKNVQYLWKHYLNQNRLPMIIYQTPLKTAMKARMNDHYSEDSDSFTGIFSKFLPEIQSFTQFWDDTMTDDENESGLELGEIRHLFDLWGKKTSRNAFGTSDEQTLDLIQYYYPNVITENYKYIQEIRCSLWDKKSGINDALDALCIENLNAGGDMPIYDAYIYYCKRQRDSGDLIVSKSYFENHVHKILHAYVLENRIIAKSWFIPPKI